jgi:hypothetical protein
MANISGKIQLFNAAYKIAWDLVIEHKATLAQISASSVLPDCQTVCRVPSMRTSPRYPRRSKPSQSHAIANLVALFFRAEFFNAVGVATTVIARPTFPALLQNV